MGDFRFSEDPSYKMNMEHGDFAVLFPGKKWLYKYFCLIYNAVSTEKVEAMTIRYFSHSKITFKADECDLNIKNISDLTKTASAKYNWFRRLPEIFL